MKRLGVNIDHVATLRQARGTAYPDPIATATLVEGAGADQITIHLREDRRHIQDADVRTLRKVISTTLNLEMACTEEMVRIASEVRPDTVTFVPERRQELTTEGGLDVTKHRKTLAKAIASLHEHSVTTSLFIEADIATITLARELGADAIELHTGAYCDASSSTAQARCLDRLREGSEHAKTCGLRICAGHGLHYANMRCAVRALPLVEEYNIGHSIIARALFVGIERAVQEMRALIDYLPAEESA